MIDPNFSISEQAGERPKSQGFQEENPTSSTEQGDLGFTLDEWVDRDRASSAIPKPLWDANIATFEGQGAVEYLLGDALGQMPGQGQQYVTAPVKKLLDKYSSITQGGWGTRDGVPYFKSWHPRLNTRKPGHAIKYETPPQAIAAPFVPRLDEETAARFGVAAGVSVLDVASADPVQPVAIVEGVKKSLTLVAHGVLAIAIRGVTQWHVKGDATALHPELAEIATPERRLYIVFDEDSSHKTIANVRAQADKLGAALSDRGCDVRVPRWGSTLGKGIDDVLASMPGAQNWLDELLANPPNWEPDPLAICKARALPTPPGAIAPGGAFDGLVWVGDNGTPKIVKAGKLAIAMECHWGDHLRYRQDLSGWFQYEATTPGLWERVSDREIRALIQRELDMAGADGAYTQGTIDSTAALLSHRVAVRRWEQPRNLIPFQNGVLDLKTRTLHPHHHRWGFTWQLPYRHEPAAISTPFIEWLEQTVGGDPTVVQLIRAILRAIITGQTHYQRYLELIGPGGTGKGTLIRAIQALLGMKNVVSTSFQRIANNRFETSRFIEKRLVLIPDADYNPTAVDVLKQLTGGDLIPYERKNENSDFCDGFTMSGWVVIATNRATIPTDGTNALFRRRLPIYFNRVVPEGQRRCLLDIDPNGNPRGEFAALLPGIFNWVLAMPDELMDSYICTPDRYVEGFGGYQTAAIMNMDSLAQWVNEIVVYAPGAWTKVGDKKASHCDCLYPSYVAYCEDNGARPLSQVRFSTALENLFQHPLGHGDVTRRRDRDRGMGLQNIRLRAINTDPSNDAVDRPVEPAPLTVERSLGTVPADVADNDTIAVPLSDRQLTRLLNLGCDDLQTFTKVVQRLTPTERRFLYTQLPELRQGVPHVVQ
jgi:P4 family phage/plasmid primase-like protien